MKCPRCNSSDLNFKSNGDVWCSKFGCDDIVDLVHPQDIADYIVAEMLAAEASLPREAVRGAY